MHTTKATVTFLLLFSVTQGFLDNGTREFRGIDDIDDSPALRIVRGDRAKRGEVPYQIAFKRKLNWRLFYTFCGGTLITTSSVISAAHCFVKKKTCDFCSKGKISKSDLKHYWAVAGTMLTKERKHQEGQWKRLSSARYPKTYKFPKDDIALVRLRGSVRKNQFVRPIKYARKPSLLDGKTCIASGYGRLSIKRNVSPTHLQVAKLEIMTKKKCNKWHGKNMDKFICTSSVKSDVAEGDSGGPLVCKPDDAKMENSEGVLVGVVCGRTTKFNNKHNSYFTRVSSFSRFLSGKGRGPRSQEDPVRLVCLCICISYIFL